MAGTLLWAWDSDNEKWIKVLVDDTGRLEMSIVIARLDDIADVNVPTPTDGYVLYWDETAGEWKVKAPGAVASLDDIGDVYVPTPTDEYLLYWDDPNSRWACRALVAGDIPNLSATKITSGELAIARLKASIKTATITFIIDGGGSAITTLEKGHLEIPFACTINQVTMMADQSGSIVVDIWKDTYANFPPLVGDSITAADKPTITTAQKSQNSTLTGWTTAITAGDILAFKVDSVTDIERVTISLKVTKT